VNISIIQIFISPYNGRQKRKKYRKINLTNDRKNTNNRTYMTHSFIDVQIYFILSMNFLIVAVKAYLADEN